MMYKGVGIADIAGQIQHLYNLPATPLPSPTPKRITLVYAGLGWGYESLLETRNTN